MVKYPYCELQAPILHLRYGSAQPTQFEYRLMTYGAIARMVNRSTSYVRRACLQYEAVRHQLQQPMKKSTRKQRRNLELSSREK